MLEFPFRDQNIIDSFLKRFAFENSNAFFFFEVRVKREKGFVTIGRRGNVALKKI